MTQLSVTIEGHVQGVFFRATTQKVARRLNVQGWVENRSDGAVEAVFEGQDNGLAQMLLYCARGPERANVTRVLITPVEGLTLPERFEVRR